MLENPSQPQTNNHETAPENPSLPQTYNHQTAAGRPPKRAPLTEKNLRAWEKMNKRQRNSAGEKATRECSPITTTTSKDFGPQLERNNVIHATRRNAKFPDDFADVRESLEQRRGSEPPNYLAYKQYLANISASQNELSMQISAYPLIAKRASAEQEISGYIQSVNYAWSEASNHLTTGLSNAKPDIFESYCDDVYPREARDALTSALAPSGDGAGMPAYAVEFKGPDGSMPQATLQCAYDGALMTEGARAVYMYVHGDKVDNGFYGKTQALTVAFNGATLKIYGHHAIRMPISSQPVGNGVDSSADPNSDALEYHQCVLNSDSLESSFERFRDAYKHIRNAHDIGYKWATKRKDALWAYVNRGGTQTSPDVAISAQQPTDSLILVASGPRDGYNYDVYDSEAGPTDQLLRESRTNNGPVWPDAGQVMGDIACMDVTA